MAARYDVMRFLGQAPGSRYASVEPHALVAVYPLAHPNSYDRKTGKSVSDDPAEGVRLARPPLLYHDHLVGVTVERSKGNHVKSATVVVQDASVLRDIPGPAWVAIWLVPSAERFKDLLRRVKAGEQANLAADGLRLLGRVHQVRKILSTSPQGMKSVHFALQCVGFSEFDAQLYYDLAVATNDVVFQQGVGPWLTRVGVDADAWFRRHATDDKRDNINTILPEILDIVLGRGASKELNPAAAQGVSGAAGAGTDEAAPNAYLVPTEIGRLLGVTPKGKALSYGELLDPLIGVQRYEGRRDDDLGAFTPGVNALMGSYLPQFPQLINTPFWSVLQQFLNPAINEMYTALRVAQQDGEDVVVPTLVMRQIPFTTDVFESPDVENVTRFRSVSRWVIPSALITHSDLGRSDATHTNLVHVYGAASQLAGNNSVTQQIFRNPPIRDDLDIQRSGPRPMMQIVEAGASAEDVKTSSAGKFMALVADWSIGSNLTLNGSVTMIGLAAPVAEGDNVEVDGMIFHVESISDEYHVEERARTWRTTLRVTNGVLATGDDPTGLHYYGINDTTESIDAPNPAESERFREGE